MCADAARDEGRAAEADLGPPELLLLVARGQAHEAVHVLGEALPDVLLAVVLLDHQLNLRVPRQRALLPSRLLFNRPPP